MIFDNSSIPECQGLKESMDLLGNLFSKALPQLKKDAFSCHNSCERTTLDLETHRILQNSFVDSTSRFEYDTLKAFCIKLSFQTFMVKVESEAYLFDFSNFLSAIGGNLGLALGFSCLTVLQKSAEYSLYFIKKLK